MFLIKVKGERNKYLAWVDLNGSSSTCGVPHAQRYPDRDEAMDAIMLVCKRHGETFEECGLCVVKANPIAGFTE